MGQLVAVQHKRGASGGLMFAKALGLCLDLGEPVRGMGDSTKTALPTLLIPPRSTAMIPPSQVTISLPGFWGAGLGGDGFYLGEYV
jgi:hypothetical protein